MKLPNKENSVIDDNKITSYLLNLEHKDGGTKAKFFFMFDFSLNRLEEFRAALLYHAINREVDSVSQNDYGYKYKLICEIETPDNRNTCIATVWVINENEDRPRLITAYPNKV